MTGPAVVLPHTPSSGEAARSMPRAVAPPGDGVPSGMVPVVLGRPLIPRLGVAELLPVLVDPLYGGSSFNTTHSTSLMRGAMAGVSLEDMPPPASASPTQMFDRPALRPENLITVARTAFGPGQAQMLAPSILEIFDTQLTQAEVTERLHLLWMMRREVASQVRGVILLGEVRREPPGAVLHELLDLTELYTQVQINWPRPMCWPVG